jgi:HNH endonuclease
MRPIRRASAFDACGWGTNRRRAMAEKTGPTPIPFEDRYVPEPNSGCWLWIGARNSDGYGCIKIDGRDLRAPRLFYELTHGRIPETMTIDHLCRVRSCVNPQHLEAVTNRENILRGDSFAARLARQRLCPKCGGPYTRYATRGKDYRLCRHCTNIRTREWLTQRMPCVLPDCSRPASARGWCQMHYLRWWRHEKGLV